MHVPIRTRIREGIFHEFRTQIYLRNSYEFAQVCTNLYEFFPLKIGYFTNGLYCMFTFFEFVGKGSVINF